MITSVSAVNLELNIFLHKDKGHYNLKAQNNRSLLTTNKDNAIIRYINEN